MWQSNGRLEKVRFRSNSSKQLYGHQVSLYVCVNWLASMELVCQVAKAFEDKLGGGTNARWRTNKE